MRDGRVLAVECVYVGVVDDHDTWEIAYPLYGRPAWILAGELPAKTAVVLNGEWRRVGHHP